MSASKLTYEHARRAVASLEHKQVAPSAANYEVWVSYHVGEPLELRAEMDRLSNEGADPIELTAEVYEKFFSNLKLGAEILETGGRFANEMTEVVELLCASSTETAAFRDKLERAAENLNRTSSLEAARSEVSGLASAAQLLAQRNAELEAALTAASRDVEAMRSALEQTSIAAYTDGLTGLANRKHFDDVVKLRKKEAEDSGHELVLVLADIDHFKRINDTFGHPTGDQVIKFVGSVLKQSAPVDAVTARFGGEEFAVLMSRVSIGKAFEMMEVARQTIENKKLVKRSSREDLGSITSSFGIAQLRKGEPVERLIGRADQCLYTAKRSGRNQVVVDAKDRAVAA